MQFVTTVTIEVADDLGTFQVIEEKISNSISSAAKNPLPKQDVLRAWNGCNVTKDGDISRFVNSRWQSACRPSPHPAL